MNDALSIMLLSSFLPNLSQIQSVHRTHLPPHHVVSHEVCDLIMKKRNDRHKLTDALIHTPVNLKPLLCIGRNHSLFEHRVKRRVGKVGIVRT